jgi:hypothetical protein
MGACKLQSVARINLIKKTRPGDAVGVGAMGETDLGLCISTCILDAPPTSGTGPTPGLLSRVCDALPLATALFVFPGVCMLPAPAPARALAAFVLFFSVGHSSSAISRAMPFWIAGVIQGHALLVTEANAGSHYPRIYINGLAGAALETEAGVYTSHRHRRVRL